MLQVRVNLTTADDTLPGRHPQWHVASGSYTVVVTQQGLRTDPMLFPDGRARQQHQHAHAIQLLPICGVC